MMNKNICYLVLLLMIISSCIDENHNKENHFSEVPLSKESRLDSLLMAPVIIDTELKKEKINNIEFFKSYKIADNAHSSYFQDSIIRFASLDGDLIEVIKNKHQEKIILLRFNSEKLNLKYGIYIGMNIEDFFLKMPEKEVQNQTILYDSDHASLKFDFDFKSNKLVEVLYTFYVD